MRAAPWEAGHTAGHGLHSRKRVTGSAPTRMSNGSENHSGSGGAAAAVSPSSRALPRLLLAALEAKSAQDALSTRARGRPGSVPVCPDPTSQPDRGPRVLGHVPPHTHTHVNTPRCLCRNIPSRELEELISEVALGRFCLPLTAS